MAPIASKSKIHPTPPKRGHIKIKIFNIVAKSLLNLATGVAGVLKKPARDGCCSSTGTVISPVELAGELKPASKHETKKNRPRRGQIKIKIVSMIATLIKDSAVVLRGKKKAAGKGGGRDGSVTHVVYPTRELKPESEHEIKRDGRTRGMIKMKIYKTTGLKNSGGKKKGAGLSSTDGIVPIETVSGFETESLL